MFGRPARFVARAPGRVNLIGEHTDYNDGFVLPMAIDREVTLVGAPREDRVVRVHSLNFDETLTFGLDFIPREAAGRWGNYVRGVAAVLRDAAFALTGFDAVLKGDVPMGSGLSSSAAIELATLMAFKAAGEAAGRPLDARLDGELAARLAQRAEQRYTGVQCGIMDQFIATLGVEGHALKIDCLDLTHEAVPMPAGARIVVIDTGASRALAASAYNTRRAECEAGAALFRAQTLRDVRYADFVARREGAEGPVMLRVGHVLLENQRVLDAVEALKRGDLEELGLLMSHSHQSLRDLYEVSSDALDAAVDIAEGVEGVYGARMTGAGFGGCAIALTREDAVDALREAIEAQYPQRTGLTPKVFVCRANAGASYRLLDAAAG